MTRRFRRLAAAAGIALAALVAGPTGSAAAAPPSAAECPNGLACRVAPAAYVQNSSSPGDYGNYDLANRPNDGLSVRYVVIHDTEVLYEPTIALFQNPLAYVSAHYVLRSADGEVTQMVGTDDVAWHAGNWWINSHGIGLENEGFAQQGYDWYTDRLYVSIARLTRYLADRYGIPVDRDRIIGHDEVPGPTSAFQAGMHWDPGPYFDWGRLMRLMGAPITGAGGDKLGRIVTINPTFQTNQPPVSACEGGTIVPQQPRPANFVYLHTAPSEDAPLVSDPFLAGSPIEPGGNGSTCANDWGSKAVTGQTFAVADRAGDWIAIWHGGKKAWLHDPSGRNTVAGSGTLITPKAGRSTIPVYGRAYPASVSTATLGYSIPAGQVYVADELVDADYYSASTYNAPETYALVHGAPGERFYKISFNHRAAFLKESDVDVIG